VIVLAAGTGYRGRLKNDFGKWKKKNGVGKADAIGILLGWVQPCNWQVIPN